MPFGATGRRRRDLTVFLVAITATEIVTILLTLKQSATLTAPRVAVLPEIRAFGVITALYAADRTLLRGYAHNVTFEAC